MNTKNLFKFQRLLFFVFLVVKLVSCGPQHMIGGTSSYRHAIMVDSFGSDDGLRGRNCYVYAADSLIETNSLLFQEFYRYLKTILENNNYVVVDDIDQANLVIFFNYGISEPYYETYDRLVPIWGYAGATTTTTGNVRLNPYSNSVTYSEQTVSKPRTQITGYQTVTRTRRSYMRFTNLVAYDLDYFLEYNKEKRIWQTMITNIADSDDLRSVFPHMLIAGEGFIGRSSGHKQTIRVLYHDERVKALRGF